MFFRAKSFFIWAAIGAAFCLALPAAQARRRDLEREQRYAPRPSAQEAVRTVTCPAGYNFNNNRCERIFRPNRCPAGCTHAVDTPRLSCSGGPQCSGHYGCSASCPALPGYDVCRCITDPICPRMQRWSRARGRCVDRLRNPGRDRAPRR